MERGVGQGGGCAMQPQSEWRKRQRKTSIRLSSPRTPKENGVICAPSNKDLE